MFFKEFRNYWKNLRKDICMTNNWFVLTKLESPKTEPIKTANGISLYPSRRLSINQKMGISLIPSASVTISNSAKTEKIEKTTVKSVKTDKIFFRI